MTDPELSRLSDELKKEFRSWEGGDEAWSEAHFEDLALRAFRLQFRAVEPFRRYCLARGIRPEAVASWRQIPPVPTAAFREVTLLVERGKADALEFRTSGSSRGPGRRGRHVVPDPELYAASLEAAFRRFVMRGVDPVRFLSLVPPFDRAPDSSLSCMASRVLERFGTEDSAFLADESGIQWSRAEERLASAASDDVPVVLFSTTLALDELVARLAERGLAFRLPPGSQVMDTGGSKGRRELDRGRTVRAAAQRLGVAGSSIVNEFGMTELLSQRYGRGLEEDAGEPPGLLGPPWLRSRALDPVTLDELPEGTEGVLCHFDLANVGSVCGVLTEDLGRVADGAVWWSGRAPGSAARGCSLATAELLAAQSAAGGA